MTQSNQDIIDYLNSIKTQNNNIIHDINQSNIDMQNRIESNENQIINLENYNDLIDQAIAYIPPDNKK